MPRATMLLTTAALAGAAFSVPAAGAAQTAAAGTGDEAMTCEQIATELVPYVRQMQPNLEAFATSEQQLYAQARQREHERKMEGALMAPLATAGALDPTGASKRAYVAAESALAAKHKSESEADANSPLAKRAGAEGEELAAQGQQLQANARLSRLMQLAQQRGCGKR